MSSKIKKAIKYIIDADYRFLIDANKGKYDDMPDDEYLKHLFKARIGYDLPLDDPKTFNEKLQWLKLYDRKPIYTTMVDKLAAKDYVAEKIGAEYIIPTLGVWDDVDDIDFMGLPQCFVLKCTHDSRGLVICKDKKLLDQEEAKKKLKARLARNYYGRHREWPYRDVPRRIIAEKYMKDANSSDLIDFKIHCFNGIPKMILVCQNRFGASGMTEDFFTPAWERLAVSRVDCPNAKTIIPPPKKLKEMLYVAEKLSEGIPFIRVDLYVVDDHVYFGELTFFPASGFHSFIPQEFDRTMGEWLTLPLK